MKLPVLISVSHAGLDTPPEVEDYCCLSLQDIIKDGDEGAGDIYYVHTQVQAFVTTSIARAFVDMNRSKDNREKDGVVKTHTCWNIPVYNQILPEAVVQTLLKKYYLPYHNKLSACADRVKFGIDCHTMAACGPPVGPDPGQQRPLICLSNATETIPKPWLEKLACCFHFST